MDMVPACRYVKTCGNNLDRGDIYGCLGREQTLLQTLLLPLCTLPILLPTPLLEPRYFLVPYVLMRAQLVDVRTWGLLLEGIWYGAINAGTMYVFLYKEREGVGRFLW
jgi:alpha-1,2-glucosyltransferase